MYFTSAIFQQAEQMFLNFLEHVAFHFHIHGYFKHESKQ